MVGLAFRLICLAALLVCAPPGRAQAPWVDPGDRQIRADLELLKAHGLFAGPTGTWPSAWQQIDRALTLLPYNLLSYPTDVRRAAARLRAGVRRFDSRNRFAGGAALAFTNEERLIRDFAGGARDEVDVRSWTSAYWGRFYARLSVGYRDDPATSDINFDGSVGALALGNWLLVGGFPDQWYGPGFDSALVLSTNAVPFPRLMLQRLDPTAIDLPLLRRLGPVQLSLSLGFDGDNRGDFDTLALVFTRLSVSPLPGLEIGLSRGHQLCGDGRQCNAGDFGRALFGVPDLLAPGFEEPDSPDSPTVLTAPGNQLVGADIALSWSLGGLAWRAYSEIAAEDGSDPVAVKGVSWTLGGSASGYWDRLGGVSWTLRGEATDTQAGRFFGLGGTGRPGIANNSAIFRDGFTYQTGFLGPSIGGDGQVFTGELSVQDQASRLWFVRYRHVDIGGKTALARCVRGASCFQRRRNLGEFGLQWPGLFGGHLALEGRFTDRSSLPANTNGFTASLELSWRQQF